MKTKKVITSARLRTTESSALLNVDSKSRSVLVGKRAGSATSAVGLIGKIAEQGTASTVLDYGVWFDLAFPHVVGIFGTRGSGKSFDLGVLIECIAGIGSVTHGISPTPAVVLFDIQDQFWTLGLTPNPHLEEDHFQCEQLNSWGLDGQSVRNVVVWAPLAYSTSLKEVRPLSLSPKQLNADDWLSLLELERYSPMGQAMLTLLDSIGPLVPSALAAHAIPGRVLATFQQGTIDGLRWRLLSLAETAIIAEQGVRIEEFLTPNRVSIVLLRQLSDSMRALVVGVVARLCADKMGSFHQTRRVARRTGENIAQESFPERLWLFLDEAHVIVPAGSPSPATGPIVDYVKRGRDAGLSMVFATQQPSAVDTRLMSQVDLTLTHALGFESDLMAAVARMPTRSNVGYELGSRKLSSMQDVLRSLEPGECVIADATNGRAFVARIRPRLTAHGGNTPI